MSKLMITMLSAGLVTLVSASCVKAQDESRLSRFIPVDLFACSYRDGQGPGDLDAVIDNWTEHLNAQEVDTHQALTLTRQYYSDAQDFDVLWLGAWKDGNAMGQQRDNWNATAQEIEAQFDAVIDCSGHSGFVSRAFKLPSNYDEGPTPTAVLSFTDCTMKEGASYDSVAEGLTAWSTVLSDNGSEAAIYQWWPVYGGGDVEFDFKLLSVYANYASLGADLERVANGELWRKRMELLGDQIECNVSRVYDGRLRRSAQLR